jgi:hypothetical protein
MLDAEPAGDNVNNMAFGAPMISEIARIVLNDP